jgi:hypothetical protein
VGSRLKKPATIKLGTFKGAGQSIKAHLEKFKICADYYDWDETDRLRHLKNSLDGTAANILFELKPGCSETDFVALLKARFGTQDQQERFRFELKTRKRRKDESTQCLYQVICRLLTLGYPNDADIVHEIVGKDCFLSALNDSVMRVKLLEREPL